ncbi:MAG TPA: hypothetical protein VIV40_02190 [Kofleriaceae bacterium]
MVAIAAAALVFAGFARTFYLRSLFSPGPLTALFVVHGIVFTSWFAVLIVQVFLVAGRRVDLHRQLGVVGAVIALAMVILGPLAAINAARHGMSLEFLATPLADIIVFALLVGTALWFRRRPDIHKRLMATATIAILPPAVARLPSDWFAGPLEVFGTTDVILLAVIVWDTVQRRRLHPAFLWGGLLLIASHPLRVMFAETSVWLSIARWLTS